MHKGARLRAFLCSFYRIFHKIWLNLYVKNGTFWPKNRRVPPTIEGQKRHVLDIQIWTFIKGFINKMSVCRLSLKKRVGRAYRAAFQHVDGGAERRTDVRSAETSTEPEPARADGR